MKFINEKWEFDLTNHKEKGFDKIFFHNSLPRDVITGKSKVDLKVTDEHLKELNSRNGNFDTSIIEELFIDFFDNGLIIETEFNKIYEVSKSTRTISGVVSDWYYLSYKIEVYFTLFSDQRSVLDGGIEFAEKRNQYLTERDYNRTILETYYNHRSLNSKLSRFNILDQEWDPIDGLYKYSNNKDNFDLWCRFVLGLN
jgi:hypothetical protein